MMSGKKQKHEQLPRKSSGTDAVVNEGLVGGAVTVDPACYEGARTVGSDQPTGTQGACIRGSSFGRAMFVENMEMFFKRCLEIVHRKNSDYTKGDADPFHNVRMCEMLGVATVEEGIVVRMSDKLARVAALVSGHEAQVLDEKLEDTLLDLANYTGILYSYLQSKKVRNEGPDAEFVLTPELAQQAMNALSKS